MLRFGISESIYAFSEVTINIYKEFLTALPAGRQASGRQNIEFLTAVRQAEYCSDYATVKG